MAKTYTNEEMGRLLKQSNPGKFDNYSDSFLGSDFFKKHPQHASKQLQESTLGGIAKGVGKEVLETVKESAGLGERLLGTLGKAVLPKAAERAIGIENAPVLSDMFKPNAQTSADALQTKAETALDIVPGSLTEGRTGAQNFGKGTAAIGTFFATPQSKITAAGKALQAVPKVQQAGKLAQFGARIAPQVATDVGIATAQTGDIRQGALAGGVSAAFPAAGAALRGIAKSIPTPKSVTSPIIRDIIPTRKALKDSQITKALDLTAGDVSNIKSSTGNNVGDWIANKGVIGQTKQETLDKVGDIFDTQYKAVRDEIGKVTNQYTPVQVPRVTQSLQKISDEMDGVIGLEGTKREVDNLLSKEAYSLGDVQRVKELIDDNYNLYNAMGDVGESKAKKGLDEVRTELKEFIEQEVESATGANIRAMNNDVATSRSIIELTGKRDTRGLTRANVSLSDITALIAGSAVNPVFGIGALFAKRVTESPAFRLRLSQWLNSLDEAKRIKAISDISSGKVPSGLPGELKKLLSKSMRAIESAAKAGSIQSND
jgi:uncharacterized protein YoxC